MQSVKMPKSIRKYIRKEKARIHRDVLDIKEQKKLINELYQKFLKSDKVKPVSKPVLQTKDKNSKINKDEGKRNS